MKNLWFVVGLLAGCTSDPPSGGVSINDSTPAFGPLSGGTRVVLSGAGFLTNGAAPNRVIIGGHEAPLAGVIDDNHLEVQIPPGSMPGDAEVVVFNHLGQASATNIFHYSTTPTVTAITPGDVLYSATNTRMTVTGSGFLDENAGFVQVLVDGTVAVDVEVASDTQLTFTVPGGTPLARPKVEIVDARGTGGGNASFRYVPSTHKGLLLFPNGGNNLPFMYFFDSVDLTVISVPRVTTQPMFQASPRAIVAIGDKYYSSSRNNQRLGLVDFTTQGLVDGVPLFDRLHSMQVVGDTVYATISNRASFGTLDVTTGNFTEIKNMLCCRSYQLAATTNGDLFVAYGDQNGDSVVAPIAKDTGVVGAPQVLTGFDHIRDIAFIDQTMYGVARDPMNSSGSVVMTIVPNTGATTVLKKLDGRITAMEVFQ